MFSLVSGPCFATGIPGVDASVLFQVLQSMLQATEHADQSAQQNQNIIGIFSNSHDQERNQEDRNTAAKILAITNAMTDIHNKKAEAEGRPLENACGIYSAARQAEASTCANKARYQNLSSNMQKFYSSTRGGNIGSVYVGGGSSGSNDSNSSSTSPLKVQQEKRKKIIAKLAEQQQPTTFYDFMVREYPSREAQEKAELLSAVLLGLPGTRHREIAGQSSSAAIGELASIDKMKADVMRESAYRNMIFAPFIKSFSERNVLGEPLSPQNTWLYAIDNQTEETIKTLSNANTTNETMDSRRNTINLAYQTQLLFQRFERAQMDLAQRAVRFANVVLPKIKQ